MKTKITFRSIALLAIFFIISVSHAAEKPSFNFGELENVATVCTKAGVVWAVHYGENKQGHVVYAIFNKGQSPSPVTSSDTFRSDGPHEAALKIQIDGKNVSAPDPELNWMMIVDGKVERGKFKPLILEEFRRFLHDKSPFSIDSIEGFDKDSERTSK